MRQILKGIAGSFRVLDAQRTKRYVHCSKHAFRQVIQPRQEEKRGQ